MSLTTILDFLQGNSDIAVAIRLFLAMVFGSVVGWERIARHHNAGIKTFALVSLGSAVATALNIYLATLPGLNADVSRIPAGVVSGIGFLGAGTILVTGRKQIKGLSTAATLWVTSCMGMAIGAGYLVVGIVCFLLVAFSNIVLMQFSNHVEQNSRYMSIYIEVSKSHGVTKFTKWMDEQGFVVVSMTKSKEKTLQSSDTGLMIDLDFGKSLNHNGLINMISDQEYVNYVEEV
ncbi:MAG: MgtC/SapB family protein [Butyrivibrio sp.]|nr:MgtC/SapB family protein [Butyrivibrio sp.]